MARLGSVLKNSDIIRNDPLNIWFGLMKLASEHLRCFLMPKRTLTDLHVCEARREHR